MHILFSPSSSMSYSVILQISRASLTPESSYIAKPAASWLDDFLVWISPEAFGCCRKYLNGSYCPPDDQVGFFYMSHLKSNLRICRFHPRDLNCFLLSYRIFFLTWLKNYTCRSMLALHTYKRRICRLCCKSVFLDLSFFFVQRHFSFGDSVVYAKLWFICKLITFMIALLYDLWYIFTISNDQ